MGIPEQHRQNRVEPRRRPAARGLSPGTTQSRRPDDPSDRRRPGLCCSGPLVARSGRTSPRPWVLAGTEMRTTIGHRCPDEGRPRTEAVQLKPVRLVGALKCRKHGAGAALWRSPIRRLSFDAKAARASARSLVTCFCSFWAPGRPPRHGGPRSTDNSGHRPSTDGAWGGQARAQNADVGLGRSLAAKRALPAAVARRCRCCPVRPAG